MNRTIPAALALLLGLTLAGCASDDPSTGLHECGEQGDPQLPDS